MKRNKGLSLILIFITVISFFAPISASAENATTNVVKSVDFDNNGVVDIVDLAEVSKKYNIRISGNDDVNFKYDVNDDSIIDIYDIVGVSRRLGERTLSGDVEETHGGLKYSLGWEPLSGSNYTSGGAKIARYSGSTLTFKFYGTGFQWNGTVDNTSGKGSVTIDGKNVATVDLYSAKVINNKGIYSINNLPLGEHEVVIENVGLKNPSSTEYNIVVDKIRVFNGESSVLYSLYEELRDGNNLVGYYSSIEEGKTVGAQLTNTFINDNSGNRVWVSHFALYQDVPDKDIFINGYKNEGDAIKEGKNFKNSYVMNLSNVEIWRGRYEVFDGTTLKDRLYIKDEAINLAKTLSNGIVRDVLDGDKIIYEGEKIVKNGYVYTNKIGLNVRSTASSSSTLLGKLNDGTKVEIVDVSNSAWYKIKYNSGYGWVSRDYVYDSPITIKKAYVVNTDGLELNVRAQATTNSAIVGKIKEGATVEVIATYGSWTKINFAGDFGYVSSEYLSYSEPKKIGYVYNTEGLGLNVRSSASTSGAVIGNIKDNTAVEIVETLTGWYKIKYGNGYGYVSSAYITFNKPPVQTGPDLNSYHYKSPYNPFAQAGYGDQCTSYAWGRSSERGTKLPGGYFLGHAYTWWNDNKALNAAGKGYKSGWSPKADSIIVWRGTTYGHVAYVEQVSGNSILVTEQNYDGRGGFRSKWWNRSDLENCLPNLSGYIYVKEKY
ncbi:MAG: SH3 domain-containing protein [Clostridium sp.]